MDYKASKYNIICRTGTKVLLFNTLSGSFVEFNEKLRNELNICLSKLEGNKEIVEYLKSKEFIIPGFVDEDEKVRMLEEKIRQNSNQLSLVIMTTEKCNFRCEYCYEVNRKAGMRQESMDKIVDFVKQRIENYESLNVEWFGGEPMLEMQVMEYLSSKLINICRDKKIPYGAGITTNGFFLTPDNVKKLKKMNVSRYQITLDGMKETHDAQRCLSGGKGSWDIIVQNLKDVRDTIHSQALEFIIRTNITREIYNSFDRYLDFIMKEFVIDKRFSFLFRVASDWGGDISDEAKSKFIGKEEYLHIIRTALEHNIPIDYFRTVLRPGGLLCYAWKEGVYVFNPEGRRVRCTLKINDYQSAEDFRTRDYSKYGHPQKCLECKKFPLCLKVNCNLSKENEDRQVECEYDVENIENLLPYLASDYYNCEIYTGEVYE